MDLAYGDGAASKTRSLPRNEQSGLSIEAATRWAHTAGRRLDQGGTWVVTRAIKDRPLTTLLVSFGLGVMTGWLIKRR
jgi:hypothetical protein